MFKKRPKSLLLSHNLCTLIDRLVKGARGLRKTDSPITIYSQLRQILIEMIEISGKNLVSHGSPLLLLAGITRKQMYIVFLWYHFPSGSFISISYFFR
jgi:hypothetical protein